jgi:hypothetical protein
MPLSAARRIPTIAYCYLSVAIGLRTQANFGELRLAEVQLRRIPLLETVRKALEKPATLLSGSPERGISAYFTSPTPAKFTTGVLLVPLFGQSLYEVG